MNDRYESPFSTRYASEYMLNLFSADTRYQTWRKLWLALAKEEKALGLSITDDQINEMSAHITDIDYELVRKREKEVRHDVMAHIYAFGKAAPSAAGIIHLGATSCYVTDNADLILYRDALIYIRSEATCFMEIFSYTLSACTACYDRQESFPVDTGFSIRSGRNRFCSQTDPISRMPRYNRNRGKFSGSLCGRHKKDRCDEREPRRGLWFFRML